MEIKNTNFIYISFLLLPLTIIVGSGVSLINVVLIGIFFLIYFLKDKETKLNNNYLINFFLIIYIYLIINTFLGIDFQNSFKRNFGFVRFILLFFAINYLFFKIDYKLNIFKFWLIIIPLLILDSYFEFIFGFNMMGWENSYGNRLVSFFKEEPVVGSYISCFILLLSGVILQFKNLTYQKLLFIIFFIAAFTIIFLSGERSNFIKITFASFLFLLLTNKFSLKDKLISLGIIAVLFTMIFNFSNYLKLRYIHQFKDLIYSDNKLNIEDNIYFQLYKSGYLVFEKNKVFGVGNKNYRVYACSENKNYDYAKFICSTSPHQIYLEFLSEHGIIGTVILLGIFIFIFFKMLKIIIVNRNDVQIACFSYLITFFLPLLPSGAFFADFNSNFFWINFSIFFAVNKETNIFK